MKNLNTHTPPFIVAPARELYDLSMLEEMDDAEYLHEMLAILLREAPKDLKEMKEALLAGNIDLVCQKAHKLKSSAGIIQAEKLVTIVDDIEVMGKNGATFNQLLCFIDNAALEYSCIEKALKIHLPELK